MEAKYIVFDGMDGSGKGTQIELLKKKFGDTIVFTREPGGTPFAEEIRKLVRDNPLACESTALNNFLLFWAAREELQENLVAPTLRVGKHIFSDRGDSSTFAFQLYGEEHQEFFGMFMHIRQVVFDERNSRHRPDRYIVFDLPAEVARERALQDASRVTTHFDIRGLKYYERVREGFRRFAKHVPMEFVDATRSPEEVHQDVISVLAKKMNIR
jgi:dTMP kinase